MLKQEKKYHRIGGAEKGGEVRKSVIICLFVLVTVILFSQNENVNWALTGAGARAAGMGGAFIGVADDATAISWNPAGLTHLERLEASFVMRSIATNRKDRRDEEFKQNHFALNFLSAAFPLRRGRDNFVVAFAVQNQLDMYKYIEYIDGKTESIGGANTFTFGFGYRIVPVLSLGASANAWYGKWTMTDTPLNGLEEKYESDFSGINYGAGLMIDFNNLSNPVPIKFGASLKAPFPLKLKWNTAVEWEIQMPLMVGFGASARIGEFFTLAIDYEIRKYKDKEITYNNGYPTDTFHYDLNQFRSGMEYLMVSDFAVIPIRFGFFTDPTSLYIEENGQVGDQIIGGGFSMGSGLIFEKFSFDLSATYSTWTVEYDDSTTDKNDKVIIGLSGIIYFG